MTENHFDQVARDWDLNKVHAERTNAIAAALIGTGLLQNRSRSLEFGAGTGLLSLALRDHFQEIVLMDSSSEMVRVCSEKLNGLGISNLQPLLFDLEMEDYPGEPFDAIFTQMVLHHVEDTTAIIRKLYSLLKPGGFLAIADLCPEDGSFHDQEFHGHLGFDPESLSLKLKKQGLGYVTYTACYTIVKQQADGTVSEFPVFLMTGIR